ncbi:MAG: M23 family peptidase [Chloroflexi bacterium]|nr:MAG: M23 family peptidase [Chloroflexota bacterium]
MKKLLFLILGVVAFIMCSGISMVQDVMLPPLIAQEVAIQAPWAAQKITQWVFRSVPERYQDDEWSGGEDDGGSSSLPGSAQVFNGGIVEYQGAQAEQGASCVMSSTRVTDCFNVPRPGYDNHGGIDYGIDPNQPVVTPMAGVVTYAGWSDVGYGFLVVIENEGVQVYLAHSNEILVSVGDHVEAGQAVALSGNTGASTGSHIHFEVRVCDPETGQCRVVDPNGFALPGQSGSCDWYFGQQPTITYESGFQYSCGVEGIDVITPP